MKAGHPGRASMRLLALAGAILLSLLVVVPPAPVHGQALPVSSTSTSKTAPGSVLAGDPIPYEISVTNTGNARLFNISARDVLPLGVSYAGPTAPQGVGEPQIIVNQVPDPLSVPPNSVTIPQQTLIWSNVADLAIGETKTLSFSVTLNETADPTRPSLPVYVVGSSVSNVAETYTSTSERVVQRFDIHGEPIAPAVPANIVESSSSPAVTVLSPIEIRKSEPSPEGELLRGVHDQTTVYTLEVEAAEGDEVNGVTGVTVTDYLSAELEFLGCGGVDNSSGPEYADRTLDDTPVIDPCITPSSVETVAVPADEDPGYPAGVYTKVTWQLADLDPGEIVTIQYAAGVPLQANAPFPGTAPAPDSLLQASNLDNNTGASTRETGTEQSARNYARVTGSYSGPVEGEDPGTTVEVSDDDEATRSIEDVRIRKVIVSPVPHVFDAGEDAHYNVIVETSEYVSASGIVVTDEIPNGLCPYSAAGYVDPAPDCGAPAPGSRLPTPAITSVVPQPDDAGGYVVTFAPIDLPPNSTDDAAGVIDYWALMRAEYEGGAIDGEPTVSGDSFTNTVESTAVTTPIGGTSESGEVTVEDESSATLQSTGVTLDKRILPRGELNDFAVAGQPCPAPSDPDTEYVNPEDLPAGERAAQLAFRLGDEVCFLIRVDFSDEIRTLNPVVVDFLPTGMDYVDNSLRSVDGSISPGTVVVEDGLFVLQPGTVVGEDRFVDPGAVLEVVFKMSVTDIPDAGAPSITGNLAKLTIENTAGQTTSYRDRTGLGIVAAPPIDLVKGVDAVDDPSFASTGPDEDDKEVREGSVATFRVDLTNAGTAATFTDYSARGFEVWDVLPPTISCVDISNITGLDGITAPALGESYVAICTDPGDPDQPAFDGATDRSLIRWQFPVGADRDYWEIDFGDTRTLYYDMTIPPGTSIGTDLVNTAALRSYQSFTNVLDVATTFFPIDNIDTTVPEDEWNAPAASDDSNVFTPGALVGKTGITSVDETNNNAPNQAVPGELVTYMYHVDIPAHTSVFGASLSDALPAQLELVSSVAPIGRYYPVIGGTSQALPTGFSLSPSGTLTFPATYTNPTAPHSAVPPTTERFEVVLTARVLPAITGEPTARNTVTFASVSSVDGSAITTAPTTYDIFVRQPTPQLAKASSTPFADAGDVVQYTLTATTGADRPPAHDAVIVDCIPAGLMYVPDTDPEFAADDDIPDVVPPVPGNGTNGCPSGTQRIAFSIGTVEPGVSTFRRYSVRVDTTAVGNDVYTNHATMTSSTLDDGGNDDAGERVMTDDAESSVTVPGASLEKAVAPATATIGERVEFTIRVEVPTDTNFYQAAIVDRLPLGLVDPQLVDSSCVIDSAPPVACPISPTVLAPVQDLTPAPPLTPANVFGLYFGDVLSSPDVRVVTIRYTALVEDRPAAPDNIAGEQLVNTAQNVWDSTNKTPEPVNGLYPWDQRGASDTALVTVVEPNLTITKQASDDTPDPAQEFTYSIVVTNTGTSEAFGTVVVDTLPTSVVLVEAAGSPSAGGVVTNAGKTITWTITDGDLAVGESVTLTYRARLAPSAGISASTPPSNFTNTARVDQYFSLPANPDAHEYDGPSVTEVVTPRFPRLTTAKTRVTTNPAYIGSPVTWRIVTTNQTNSGTAYATRISDTLPPNWTFNSTTSIVGPLGTITPVPAPVVTPSPSGDQLVWTLGALAAGQNYTVTFTATPGPGVDVPPALPATFTNRTTSTANDGSGASGNLGGAYTASSSATARIDRVDLALDKSHSSAPVAGENFSWSIVVRNNGPSTAVGPFVVTDAIPTLPTGVTFASASGPGTGWTCTPATGPASPPTTGNVTCQRTNSADTLASGTPFPAITFTVRLPSDTPDGTQISNTAVVGGQRTYERVSDLPNNTDTDATTITTRADLSIAKTLDAPLVAGTNASYTFVVTNNGPSTSRATVARPIVVTDTLPAGTTFVSASPGCTHTAGVVRCVRTTDLLRTGTWTNSVTVSLTPSASGPITNTAVVAADITTDPNGANNTSAVTAVVGANADLGIVKTHTGASTPGEPTAFNMKVTNLGPSDAATVRITDTLPAGLTFSGFSNVTGSWNCVVTTAPQFRCDLLAASLPLRFTGNSLADVAEVSIQVNTAANITGSRTNTAVVSSTTPDGNPTNNSSSAIVTFVGVADLALTKSSSGTAVPGGNISWTIAVENRGPSDSQNPITVTDVLPAGMSAFVSASGTGWVCTIDTAATPDAVSCVKSAPLAAGATSTLTIVGTTNPSASPLNPITNSATVVPSTGQGPNVAPDTDTDTVTFVQPDVSIVKTVGDPTPQPGETFAYTVRLANGAGLPNAYNLVVTDDVPDGIAVVPATISNAGVLSGTTTVGGVQVGGTITWNIAGPIVAGTPLDLTYSAELAPSDTITASAITNVASLDSYASLPSGGRTYTGGEDDATVTPRFPKLTIVKEALGSTPTYIGEEFAWQITVTNSGLGDAALVSVADTLPPNWTFVPGSAVVTAPTPISDADEQPLDTTAGDPPVTRLTWDDLGPLEAGQSLTVSIRTIPTADVADEPGVGRSEPHTNTASAGAEDGSGATANDTGDYGALPTTAVAYIDAADLVVTKSNAATSAIAGAEYTWTIDVENLGPDEAIGPFVVTDELPVLTPVALTYVSATGDGWTCTQAAGVVTCVRSDTAETLPDGAAFPPISVTVRIPPDYLSTIDGPLENTATVDARTFDPDESNNESVVETPVDGSADLRIVKDRGTPTIVAGQPLTYFLDVTNLGPSTSRSVITVIDTLPAQVRFVSAPVLPATPEDPWDCVLAPIGAPSGGTVTCTLVGTPGGALPANAAAPRIPITVDVLSSAQPDVAIENVAIVASTGTTDPVPENNRDTDTGTPTVLADLAIDKDAQGVLVAGQNATYRLTVVNNGPSDAAAPVRISDTLPTGLTFVGFTSVAGTWSCPAVVGATSFTCDLTGALAPGVEVIVDVEVAVASNVIGTVVNAASVSTPTPESNYLNNTDSDTSPFGTSADLAIQKANTGSPVKAGEDVTWELVVTNNGPSDSQPVITVVDNLPASVDYVSATGDGWACTVAPATLPAYSDTVTCSRAAALEAQSSPSAVNHIAPTITIVAEVLPTSGPGSILNGASVASATTDDGNPLNNFDFDIVQVIDDVDVSVVKTASPATVRAGETSTYTIQVANAGPSTADNIVVTDTMPSGVTIETLTATGWTCPLSTTVAFRCELAALDPGSAPVITVLVRVGSGVADGTVLPNTSSVTTSSPDRLLSNNSSTANITIVADADLGITKTHPVDPDDPIAAGGSVEFEMNVVNNGPSDAIATVTIEDQLPAGFHYVSVSGPWSCAVEPASDPEIVNCDYLGGGLIVGGSAEPMFLTAVIDQDTDAGQYDNVAIVDSPTIDTDPANDRATDTVVVGTLADLGIAKTHDTAAVRIGEEFDFTLQVNNAGPSEARDVVVTDSIPGGLTLVRAAGAAATSTWDCTASVAPEVSCALEAPLAAGADAEPILVTVLVEPEAFPGLDNRAEVTSSTSEPDPDPTPNFSVDPVVVPPLVDLYVQKSHGDTVVVGEEIVYTLTVGNLGPIDDSALVTVTDALPAGLTPTAATSPDTDVSCAIEGQTVTCERDGLAVDETFTVEITADVLPAAYPSVINTARVGSDTDDRDPLNNVATDPAVVPPLVDLAITKSHVGPVAVGGQITYTVSVTNNGPTPDPGPVRILDTLPGSLTPVSATGEGMTCVVTGQNVACEALAPLGVGEVLVATIVADVGPAAYPSVENSAIVTTPGCTASMIDDAGTPPLVPGCPDTDLTNNAASDVATVAPLVRLQLVKTLASQVGATATWNFDVSNAGPNPTVEPIRLIDNLPATLTFVSATGVGWQCTHVMQVVACVYAASVAPGTSAPLLQMVTTMSGVAAGTQIVNLATVGGGGPDVSAVSDDAVVIAPGGLPNTGGGAGILLRWAPTMVLIGLAMVIIARRRRDQLAI